MIKRNALGRGLGALIEENDMRPGTPVSNEVGINEIEANPFQPRLHFDEESLNELAVSIKEFGIIQPLTLRKLEEGKYQIIAGERRFRAAKIAGLTSIPSFVREAGDESMLELALVENIQREDLDAIEIDLLRPRSAAPVGQQHGHGGDGGNIGATDRPVVRCRSCGQQGRQCRQALP